MKKVYACLLGQWTELTEDEYLIGYTKSLQSPSNWLKTTEISQFNPTGDDFFKLPLVFVKHFNKTYEISPYLIQIVYID